MDVRKVNQWLAQHDVTLEQGFAEALRDIAYAYKRQGYTLEEVYRHFNCTKVDIFRWQNNPCSTHATTKAAKLKIVHRIAEILSMEEADMENLANKAGLSVEPRSNGLLVAMEHYHGKYADLQKKAAVSERMFQYYMSNKKEPTKEALLAIAIVLHLGESDIEKLLKSYGYCLSKSLPNDAVIQYYLQHRDQKSDLQLLETINEKLFELALPVLMTKNYR